jgi:hypothetical protein
VPQAGMDALPAHTVVLPAYGEDASEPLGDPPRVARAVVVGLLLAAPLWAPLAGITWVALHFLAG